MKRIKLHKQYGLNPSLSKCHLCGEPKDIILFGSGLKGEAPHESYFDKKPCRNCRDLLKQGVMLISVRDGEKIGNPFRTGKLVVITDEGFRKTFGAIPPERVAYIEDSVGEQAGLWRFCDGENKDTGSEVGR